MNSIEYIRWTIVAPESAFDQLKLNLNPPHLLTRTPRAQLKKALGESDVILMELEQSGSGFDFRLAAEYGLPVPFLLRSDTEGQYVGVCRFGLHKEIFSALTAVGEWWELRAGRSRPYEVFRKLLNRVSDGIAELDSSDRIRWVNTSLKQAIPDVKWEGAHLQDIVRKEDKQRLRALRTQHSTGVVVPFAVHLPNGEQVELDPSPWFDEQGELVGTSLLFREVRNTQEQENRANELFCMYSLATSLGQVATVEEALETALERTTDLLNLPAGGAILNYESTQISQQHRQEGDFSAPLDEHFQKVVRNFPSNKKALVKRELDEGHWLQDFGLNGYAIVPIEIGEKRVGGLWLVSRETGRFARETVSLLISIVNQLAVIIENLAHTQAQLTAELEKKRFYKDALCAVTGGKLNLCDRTELEQVWQAAGSEEGRVEIRAKIDVPKSRHFVEASLVKTGLADEKIQDAALCSTEAVGNVVKHADSGSLAVRHNDLTVTICISDQGPGIDFTHLPNAVLNLSLIHI